MSWLLLRYKIAPIFYRSWLQQIIGLCALTSVREKVRSSLRLFLGAPYDKTRSVFVRNIWPCTHSLFWLSCAGIGSEQLCSFSRGIFQPICKHFVCVQLFLKLWTNTYITIHGSYLWAFCSSFHHSRSTASSVDESNGSRNIVITKFEIAIFWSRDYGNGQARNVNNQNGILRDVQRWRIMHNNKGDVCQSQSIINWNLVWHLNEYRLFTANIKLPRV